MNVMSNNTKCSVFKHLDVRGVPLAVVPGALDGVEEPVGVVELARLEGEELRGEGLQPQQVVQHEGRRRVVRAVVERRDLQKSYLNSLGMQKNQRALVHCLISCPMESKCVSVCVRTWSLSQVE